MGARSLEDHEIRPFSVENHLDNGHSSENSPDFRGKGSKELAFNISRNDTTMSSQMSGSLHEQGGEQAAVQVATEEEEEDYDSDDEPLSC